MSEETAEFTPPQASTESKKRSGFPLLAGLAAFGLTGLGLGAIAWKASRTPLVVSYRAVVPLQTAQIEVSPATPQSVVAAEPPPPEPPPLPKLREVTETWDNPHTIAVIPAGTNGQEIVTQYPSGGTGYMTLLGTLWVPAGANGDLFYYELRLDGLLVDRIFRVIGAGSSVSQTTGIPSPARYDPPLGFHRKLELKCFNLDSVDHVAEVYVGGFFKRLVP